MAEYIEREALIDYLTRPTGLRADCEDCTDVDCLDCIVEEVIRDRPAADVAPVRHGRWLPTTKWWQGGSAWKQCSECGRLHCGTPNYCNNCGAKMDGGDTNG